MNNPISCASSANIPDSQCEYEVPLEDQESSGFFDKVSALASVSELLRIFGACAVLASMSLFLLNGWSEGNDIQRYLKLLAQTGLLSLAGVVLSAGLREFKGARLFFGLSLISVAANFTILGALVYSMIQWDNALQEYPSALTWQALDVTAFWPLFGGAALLLAVLSRFSFGIFARRHAALLSASFLLLCGGLLIPLRDSAAIAVLIGLAVLAAAQVVQRVRRAENFVNTPEANFALATLFLPPAIMLARALSLYHVDAVLAITLSGLLLFALRAQSLRESARTANSVIGWQRLSGIIQFILACNISLQLASLMPDMNNALHLAAASLAMFTLSLEYVFSKRHVQARRQHLQWSIALLLLANFAAATLESDLSFRLLFLLMSLACLGLAHLCREQLDSQAALSMSAVATVVSGGLLAIDLVTALRLGNWVIIGLLGGGLIVAASLYERFASQDTD